MRANSLSFIEIAEKCRDIFGEISRSMAWICSLVWAPARHQKIADTRSSGSPASSSAASVFSMVAASELPAIASISASCALSAASNTGPKSPSPMREKSGRPSGPSQWVSGWLARSTAVVSVIGISWNGSREAGTDVRALKDSRNRFDTKNGVVSRSRDARNRRCRGSSPRARLSRCRTMRRTASAAPCLQGC